MYALPTVCAMPSSRIHRSTRAQQIVRQLANVHLHAQKVEFVLHPKGVCTATSSCYHELVAGGVAGGGLVRPWFFPGAPHCGAPRRTVMDWLTCTVQLRTWLYFVRKFARSLRELAEGGCLKQVPTYGEVACGVLETPLSTFTSTRGAIFVSSCITYCATAQEARVVQVVV
jgi:hypothetical protein